LTGRPHAGTSEQRQGEAEVARRRSSRYARYVAPLAVGLVLGASLYALVGPDAARLADGVQVALVVVIAGAIGVFGVIVAAGISADATRAGAAIAQRVVVRARVDDALAREQDRATARQERDADREDGRLERFADRKLSLAVDLLLAADGHASTSRDHVAAKAARWAAELEYGPENETPLPEIGSAERVRNAFQALDLVAPAVGLTASSLYLATVRLASLAGGASAESQSDPDWVREWDAANERWSAARLAFVDAVRRDLGVLVGHEPTR
jgi:hypothetical protein